MSAYVLNDRDVKLIQGLLDAERRRTQPLKRSPEDVLQQSPEVYIARTLTGIPALTEEPGTGTGENNDTPGAAYCDIYQLIGDNDEATLELTPVFNKLVYNLSTSAIPRDVWVLIIQDKYGRWLAVQVFGGSTDCHALTDVCTGEVYYQRTTNGVINNSGGPCPACEDVIIDPVPTVCCDLPINAVLCLRAGPVVGGSGPLTELGSLSATLHNNGIGDSPWIGSANLDPTTLNPQGAVMNVQVVCSTSDKKINVQGVSWYASDGAYHVVWDNEGVVVCDPFSIARSGRIFGGISFATDTGATVTVTVTEGVCVPCVTPTVTLNTADLVGTSASITISGTGFSATPAENIVVFDQAAAGIVTASTTTSLTVDFTIHPPFTGVLKAKVIVNGCPSSPFIQVATIINPIVTECDMSAFHCDTATDTDGVHLDAHTPEIGDTYTVTDGVPGIYGNRIVDLAGGGSIAFNFDESETEYTWTFKYLVPPTSQDSGYRTLQACFRYTDSNNNFTLFLQFPPMSNSIVGFDLYKFVSGVPTLLDSGVVTLTTDVLIPITIEVSLAGAAVTIFGETISVADTDLNTATGFAMSVASGNSSVLRPCLDDIIVMPPVTVDIEITHIGTSDVAGPNSSATYSVTVVDGLLVVTVGLYLNVAPFAAPSVTFNGVAMNLDAFQPYHPTDPDANAAAVFSLPVSAGTHNIVITPTEDAHIQSQAIMIAGLTNNTLDKVAQATDLGLSFDTGATATTAVADEAAVAVFCIKRNANAPWTWGGGFVSGGQDLASEGVWKFRLTEATQILSATGTVDADVTADSGTSGDGCGIVVTYS